MLSLPNANASTRCWQRRLMRQWAAIVSDKHEQSYRFSLLILVGIGCWVSCPIRVPPQCGLQPRHSSATKEQCSPNFVLIPCVRCQPANLPKDPGSTFASFFPTRVKMLSTEPKQFQTFRLSPIKLEHAERKGSQKEIPLGQGSLPQQSRAEHAPEKE